MTRYDPGWVRSHYDDYAEKEWERWDRDLVQKVKFHVHLHYLQRHVRSGDRVLEVGAGAGRFTRELAGLCRSITVADISPVQLDLNRAKAREFGFEEAVEAWVECDVCDLRPHFADGAFDAVVCYGGPLSYVFERRDDAARELLRVVAPGGAVLVSVMGLWGTVHEFLPGVMAVDRRANRRIVATGDLTPELVPASQRCHMFRAAELRECLERAGASVEAVSASNCLSTCWNERLPEWAAEPDLWGELLAMEVEACRESGCLDVGSHIIAVCRRP